LKRLKKAIEKIELYDELLDKRAEEIRLQNEKKAKRSKKYVVAPQQSDWKIEDIDKKVWYSLPEYRRGNHFMGYMGDWYQKWSNALEPDEPIDVELGDPFKIKEFQDFVSLNTPPKLPRRIA